MQFQIRKDKYASGRLVETPSIDQIKIQEGEILVKIDRFAYTANNITYAVAGDMLGYWQFFPPHNADQKDWGVIPVWGFADVISSKNEGIPVGDRLYGYFPPSETLTLSPTRISDRTFIDGAAHRSKLPAGYNMYRRVLAEPGYNRAHDKARMVLFPLHLTSFCLWDALVFKEWHGAKQVVILSASSKTSIGLAFALHQDDTAPTVIGLTSSRNLEMVKGLELYDNAMTYDQVSEIDATIPTVIVDMSGNKSLMKQLYNHLGDNMNYCINVGITHWDQAGGNDESLKVRSEFFFAPSHIQMRLKDWGPDGFEKKTSSFLKASMTRAAEWLTFEELDGLQGLSEIHEDMCAGNIAADKGLVVIL